MEHRPPEPFPISRIPIVSNENLSGCATAVMIRGTLNVSPAFFELLASAKTPEEIDALIASLEYLSLPDLAALPFSRLVGPHDQEAHDGVL